MSIQGLCKQRMKDKKDVQLTLIILLINITKHLRLKFVKNVLP